MRLAVNFYSMDGIFEGQGYYMPDEATFVNYAVNELGAVKIGDNKYKHPRRDSYISLEESKYTEGEV
jgi:hypothetical protein